MIAIFTIFEFKSLLSFDRVFSDGFVSFEELHDVRSISESVENIIDVVLMIKSFV
jgi:hypothetical protein